MAGSGRHRGPESDSKPMATNKNALIRYMALDECFRDYRHRYYIDDLIEACHRRLESFNFEASVSRRQVFDDVRFMESDAGWGIPLDRLKDGKRTYYRYSDRDFSIKNQPLTDDEARQLKTLIVTLDRFRGLPSYGWVEELVSSLEWHFNLKGGRQECVVAFEQNEQFTGLKFLGTVLDAASSHQVMEILYHNYKNGGRDIFFTLHPYYVKQYNNRWFVFGLDDKYGNIATLALDRIVKIDLVDDIPFVENHSIDFDHYFDDVVGVTIPDPGVAREHIVMRFAPGRFPYVVSKPIHRSQAVVSAAACTLSIDVRPNNELMSQLLAFGPDVEILEPPTLRVAIARQLKAACQHYGPRQREELKI